MRNLIIYLSALSSLSSSSAIRHGASQLRDILAFPKYEVQFLNDLPLAASDAERCGNLGIEREDEFLTGRLDIRERKRIGDGGEDPVPDKMTLLPMSLTPPGSSDRPTGYLCLMPSPNTTAAQTIRLGQIEEAEEEPDPLLSWQALSHLDGKCLFSKQGWFTYSYCHNSHIRQFREARHPHPHPPGGYIPEEDPKYDAYTLGQTHIETQRHLPPGQSQPQSQSRSTLDPNPIDQNQSVSFGLSASSRYLVQRWSDGTTCDKTGQPRETEIQIHCSMTTNDMIYTIKELALCSYVLIIHSPHLCSLPGFKANHIDVEPAPIRCRQIVSDEDYAIWTSGGGAPELPAARPKGLEHVDTGGKVEIPSVPTMMIENVDEETLRGMLSKAMEVIAEHQKGKAEGESDKVEGNSDQADDIVMLSWEEDEDGQAVFLDAELLKKQGERDQAKTVDRDEILRIVKEYLETKDSEEDKSDRPRDEL